MGQFLQFVASYGVYAVIAFMLVNMLILSAPHVLVILAILLIAKDILIDHLKLAKAPWFLQHPYFEHNPFNIAVIYYTIVSGVVPIGIWQTLFLLAVADLVIDGVQDITLLSRGVKGEPLRATKKASKQKHASKRK